MNGNLYLQVERATPTDSATPLLEDDAGQSYSWKELHAATARYANLLCALGVQPGDRVAVCVDKSPQALFLYLACLRAGLVYLPLNTAYRRSELGYFLADAEPRVIVCRPHSEDEVRTLAAPSVIVMTLDDRGVGSFAQEARARSTQFSTASVGCDELAAIIYTSGTTGRSKGAMITHRNLESNARALVGWWNFHSADVLLHALPVFHVHGLFVANHCALLSGARMLWHRKFEAEAVVRDLPRATVLMGVPTFYIRLLAEPAFTREVCGHVRMFISGSAPLLTETFREFEARTGQRILERYGMSETGMITSNPLEGTRKAGSVGIPLPGVSVRIVDENDRVLRAGEVGRIQVLGDNVFKGYWNMPEKTREEFTADQWFRTGDLGCFDTEGYLSIVGRAKDLIISGGYNVYPKEIELAIDAIPGVAESAVIGLPDPDFGEAVTAVVVLHPGAPVSEQAVVARLKGELANYKVPKRVVFVSDLPRNAMGKVQKALLRERYR